MPPGLAGTLRVTAGDDDVTAAFPADGEQRRGLVTGLPPAAPRPSTARVGDAAAVVEVTDHPPDRPGALGTPPPLWSPAPPRRPASGHRPTPTAAPRPSSTTSTSPPPAPSPPLPDAAARPADLATAVVGGERVPLVVRRERGVINRGDLHLHRPGARARPAPGDRRRPRRPVDLDAPGLERPPGLALRRRVRDDLRPGRPTWHRPRTRPCWPGATRWPRRRAPPSRPTATTCWRPRP